MCVCVCVCLHRADVVLVALDDLSSGLRTHAVELYIYIIKNIYIYAYIYR